jgi:hypothetical protein
MLFDKLSELNKARKEQLKLVKESEGTNDFIRMSNELVNLDRKIKMVKTALKEMNDESFRRASEAGKSITPTITGIKTKKKGEKFDKDAWLSMIGPSREDYEKQIVAQQDFQKKMYDDAKKWSEEAARLHWEASQKKAEADKKDQDKEEARLEDRALNYQYFGEAIGASMAQGIAGGEGSMKDALKDTLGITISFLEKQMIAATVGNQIRSFMAMGPIGLLKATGEAALITGIFETAKAGIMAFKDGGIVDYGTRSGDRTIARVNKNEMILNEQQQANLWKAANNGSQAQPLNVYIQDSSGTLVDTITTKMRNGDRGVDRLMSEIMKRVR